MRTIKQDITILETPTGWLNKHTGRTHTTAAHALRAVRRNDRALASQPGTVVVTALTWEPTTRAGSIVATAISEAMKLSD
jgi:hypothetical protein